MPERMEITSRKQPVRLEIKIDSNGTSGTFVSDFSNGLDWRLWSSDTSELHCLLEEVQSHSTRLLVQRIKAPEQVGERDLKLCIDTAGSLTELIEAREHYERG